MTRLHKFVTQLDDPFYSYLDLWPMYYTYMYNFIIVRISVYLNICPCYQLTTVVVRECVDNLIKRFLSSIKIPQECQFGKVEASTWSTLRLWPIQRWESKQCSIETDRKERLHKQHHEISPRIRIVGNTHFPQMFILFTILSCNILIRLLHTICNTKPLKHKLNAFV